MEMVMTTQNTDQQRAEQAEAANKKLRASLQVYMRWCQLLMAELVKRGIQAPAKPKGDE